MNRGVYASMSYDDLEREGLSSIPEVWEDGLRTSTGPGSCEWWNFEARFDDGLSARIIFFTKPILDPYTTLKPGVQVMVTLPGDVQFEQVVMSPAKDFFASAGRCDLRIGSSWALGDLHTYRTHTEAGDMVVDLTFESELPAWRPGAGKNYFNLARSRFLGWLAPIPFGCVTGKISYHGKTHEVKGTGYHDHHWGNVGLGEVFSYWYWGRAHVGDYTILFSELVGSESYDRQKLHIFLLAKGNRILTQDGEPLRLTRNHFEKHSSGRSYPQHLDFHWKSPEGRVHLSLRNPQLREVISMKHTLSAWKRPLSLLTVENPYRLQFQANLELLINLEGLQTHEKGLAYYDLMLLK